MIKKSEVTTGDIMGFLQEHMVTKEELHNELKGVKGEFKQEMQKQKLEIMDSMDEKLAGLKGDLVVMMRKEDKKVSTLIELLAKKKILNKDEAEALLEFRPFPQM